jgi:hypothetical protein
MKARDGWIYLIQQEQTNLYKIGFTQDHNIQARLSSLQVGNPNPLVLVGSFYTYSVDIEKDLHAYLRQKEKHVSGEWFELTAGDVSNLLDPDWRIDHGLYGDHEEVIIDSMMKDWDLISTMMERFMRNVAHLAHMKATGD